MMIAAVTAAARPFMALRPHEGERGTASFRTFNPSPENRLRPHQMMEQDTPVAPERHPRLPARPTERRAEERDFGRLISLDRARRHVLLLTVRALVGDER